MTLTQEQVNIAFSVIIAFIAALTAWLNNKSKKRHAETQEQLTEVKAKVDEVHAAVTGGQATPASPFLVDGHELPRFEKPPAWPLP